MVKILANGEVVQDDDPRLQAKSKPPRGVVRQHHHDDDEQERQVAGQAGGGINVFEGLNQRLLDAGFPRWNLGPYVIQPIVSVGFLLALVIFGLPGILFAGLLFAVCKMSEQAGGVGEFLRRFTGGGSQGSGTQQPGGNAQSHGPRSSGQWKSDSGHRLGRS